MVYNVITSNGPQARICAAGTILAVLLSMLRKLARLFVIKNRFEAYAVIYALAVGAVGRGFHYISEYPGVPGLLLFSACTSAVFMAGAKILDATRPRWKGEERRCAERRRATPA